MIKSKLIVFKFVLNLMSLSLWTADCRVIPINDFNVKLVHDLIRQNYTCYDIVNQFLTRAYKYNDLLNVVINYNPNALVEAKELDNYYATNKQLKGRLHCVPFLIKDITDVENIPTTGGIKALRYSIPRKNAPIITYLKNHGAVILAKVNLAELAEGSDNSETGGLCKNPFDLNRTCGPSSTGSGAGISSGLGLIALGTDTDGSIMNPSAYNSIFGLRSPQGLVNFDGTIHNYQRSDTIGPMAKNLDDLVLAYSILLNNPSYYDNYLNRPTASYSVLVIENFLQPFNITLTVPGVFSETLTYLVDRDVLNALENTVGRLMNLNITLNRIRLTDAEMNQMTTIVSNEALSKFGCYENCYKYHVDPYFSDRNRFPSDSPYKSFDDIAKSVLLSDFWKGKFTGFNNVPNPEQSCSQACVNYDLLKTQFNNFFVSRLGSNTAVLLPTTGILPYPNRREGAAIPGFGANLIAPYAGLASLSFPGGFSNPTSNAPSGLPIGLMFLTNQEKLLNTFRMASAYEKRHIKPVLPPYTPELKNEIYSKC